MNAFHPVLRAIAPKRSQEETRLPEPALAAGPDPTQWRRGFPPREERLIRIEDGSLFRFPQLRWSFNHARELGPTKSVWRSDGAITPLNRAGQGLDHLRFAGPEGARLTLAQALAQTYADGFIVLRRGRIVHESYAGEGAAHRPHIWMSVTKSLIGTIAATLIYDGALDADAFAKLPRGAIVVNTARGDLVNDGDLIAALKSGQVGYAGLDVFEGEPDIHSEYYRLENVFLLPHMGTSAIEARDEMGFAALDNIDAVLAGREGPSLLV